MAHNLPDLPYDFDALEPHIDARTMEIHHGKHHQGYVTKLNAALEQHSDLQGKSVAQLISDLEAVPEDIRTTVRNNGGGHVNHSLFWLVMSPDGGEPSGKLAHAIKDAFGGLDSMKEKFSNSAATRFGSGWAWLIVSGGSLDIMSTPNQDSPLTLARTPILGLDVWEHAYYLNYQNRRPDYIAAWWNLVNWEEVARRFSEAE